MIDRGEWSALGVFMISVRERIGLTPEAMDNKALTAAILRSPYIERNPLDQSVVRITDPAFWEDLAGPEVIAHDARTRLGS